MALDTLHVRALIQSVDLRTLFVDELGWNRFRQPIEIALPIPRQQQSKWTPTVDRTPRNALERYTFRLQAVAEKCGIGVYACAPYFRGTIPDYTMRCELERRLRALNHHHLIIFTGYAATKQIWHWTHRSVDGQTDRCEHVVDRYEVTDDFLRRLATIAFSIVEEETLTLTEALTRVETAFQCPRRHVTMHRARLDDMERGHEATVFGLWVRMAYLQRGLSLADEVRLARAYRAGDMSAGERLIASHIYLPVEMAWKLARIRGIYGAELEDLVHDGYISLYHALRTFGADKGQRFQTHAGFWVRKTLDRAMLEYSRIVDIPAYIDEQLQPIIRTLGRVEDALAQRLMRQPTGDEMAAELGLPPDKVSLLGVATQGFRSLDSSRIDSDSVHSACEATLGKSWSEIASSIGDIDYIGRLVSKLRPRERDVLTMRFGLAEQPEFTLDEIAIRLRVTRERIRQLEGVALRHLKAAAQVKDQISAI